jgi:hypothetical protein
MKVSTLNAQGSRLMKIYVATMEMIRKKERHDET